MINEEFADWLLTHFAQQVIDAVKEPGERGNELLRTIGNLPAPWRMLITLRIEELPR